MRTSDSLQRRGRFCDTAWLGSDWNRAISDNTTKNFGNYGSRSTFARRYKDRHTVVIEPGEDHTAHFLPRQSTTQTLSPYHHYPLHSTRAEGLKNIESTLSHLDHYLDTVGFYLITHTKLHRVEIRMELRSGRKIHPCTMWDQYGSRSTIFNEIGDYGSIGCQRATRMGWRLTALPTWKAHDVAMKRRRGIPDHQVMDGCGYFGTLETGVLYGSIV
jgi:hypothetical protein